ncbi:MAG: peptide deformylase [Anaerorhabdus sp.]
MKINNNTIIKDSDPLIRESSFPVDIPLSKEDTILMESLILYVKNSRIEEIAEAENLRPAVGISAIQVGVKKQMCVIIIDDVDKNNNDIHIEYALVNPKIISKSVQKAYLKGGEGCLSVENQHEGLVNRHARIKVSAYDYFQKKQITFKAQNYLAIVLQHEFDHFSGRLFYDYINEENPFEHDQDAIEI